MALSQEQFDTVLFGIREQGGPSIERGDCRYRAASGRKCAAGWLIPDEMYSSDLERRGATSPPVSRILARCGVDPWAADGLQAAHDDSPRQDTWFFAEWEPRMAEIAASYDLHYTPPEAANA